MDMFGDRKLDGISSTRAPGMHGRPWLIDVDRRASSRASGDGHQSTLGEQMTHIDLLVAGFVAGTIGQHPHLDEMGLDIGTGIVLRMTDTCAR